MERRGKRDLNGKVIGYDFESPVGLDECGERMFNSCIEDRFDYEEAENIAREWQRLEEKDSKYR